MGGIGKQLGIVLTSLVASVGLIMIAAPEADAKTVDVDKWAKGFCTSIEDWETTTSKAHDLIQTVIDDGVSTSAKAKATRQKIVDLLGAASKKSTSASKAVKALGDPAIANGANVSSTIATAIGSTSKAFSVAKDDAAKAPTDPKQFRSAMSTISDHVDRDLSKAGEEISRIDALDSGGALDDAFKTEPACSFLSNS
jgi:hypothetical protein